MFFNSIQKSVYQTASPILSATMNSNKYGTVPCSKRVYNLITEVRFVHMKSMEDIIR